ncbi:hypothetical protein RHMOL_Rhmol12G0168600 [Rhododendron molle]|uniref:Uncharacterized protein n=1 Tax=Rhododendron molle TaxID=49168 RepID=A0ACC0LK07_RHOML|nr:hypothetical protein RHMOL_Rhmol12G0168600 [Rhododendron molle]
MRSEPSDARSDGSKVHNAVLRTPLHSTIPPILTLEISWAHTNDKLLLTGRLGCGSHPQLGLSPQPPEKTSVTLSSHGAAHLFVSRDMQIVP